MRMKRYFILSFLIMVFFPIQLVHGEGNQEASNLFSISPLNPETGEPQSSYYELTVVPNEKKQVKIRVFNSDVKSIIVDIAANNATTNDNGITSYLESSETDSSLKVGFSDIAKIETNKIEIEAGKTVDVPVDITIPERAFEGVILGGIRVTSVGETKAESKKENAAVTNNIAYTVGVVLSENSNVIDPKMSLNSVKTEQRNGRNYISANVQNSAPRMIKKLEATAQVFKKGSTKVLYEVSRSNMRMAPNSNFNFGISLEDQPFIAGNYTMAIKGSADGFPFDFKKEFTITKKEEAEFNKNAVYVEKQPQNYLLIGLLILLFLILVGSGIWLFTLKRKGKS